MQKLLLDFLVGLLACMQVIMPIYIYYIIITTSKRHKYLIVGVAGLILFVILKLQLYTPEPGTYADKIIWGLANVAMWYSILIFLQRKLGDHNIHVPGLIKDIFIKK